MRGYNMKSPNELYHHGIKGQKWGVRRYQNPDGSLTSAGKKRSKGRYSEDASSLSDSELRRRVNRMDNENRYINLTKPKNSKLNSALDTVDTNANTARDANKAYKTYLEIKDKDKTSSSIAGQGINVVSNSSRLARRANDSISYNRHVKRTRSELSSMSDSDLSRRVERMNLERRYSDLNSRHISEGRISVNDALSVAGGVMAIGASAVTIAVGIQKLRNGGKG